MTVYTLHLLSIRRTPFKDKTDFQNKQYLEYDD